MTNQVAETFNREIVKLVKLGRPKIAFGLIGIPELSVLESIQKGQEFADIILVGPPEISSIQGLKTVIDIEPEKKIAQMLASDEVDGIVRGTIDAFKADEEYERLTGEKTTFLPGHAEDCLGRQYFISPISNTTGWDKEERLIMAKGMAEFLQKWGITPKIAIFTGRRHETYPRKKHLREGIEGILNKSYEDADWLVEQLTKEKMNAKNCTIELNTAVEDGYNVLVPVNGMVGNQIMRAIMLSGGRMLSATRLGLSRFYEDNSRTEKDFLPHIKWLVALINAKRSKNNNK